MGTVELHTWNAHASNVERPDRIVFDLDPDPALPWRAMIDAAQLVRGLLDELGLASFCKTSGGKGLHVVVPLTRHAGWDDVKDFSRAVAQHVARALTVSPRRWGRATAARSSSTTCATAAARHDRRVFGARAAGMGVSVPLDWDEVPDTTGGAQWTIDTLRERLDALKRDPWEGYARARQHHRVDARAAGALKRERVTADAADGVPAYRRRCGDPACEHRCRHESQHACRRRHGPC